MPLRSDWSQASCPMARSLEVVGDPWTLLVLREAFTGTTRFDGFRSALGVADNVLSRRLAGLVEAGLLRRSPYDDGGRTRQEYLLTEAGEDLLPVLHALAHWGDAHRPHGRRLDVVHEGCGEVSDSADTCSACGDRLTPDVVSWRRPRPAGEADERADGLTPLVRGG